MVVCDLSQHTELTRLVFTTGVLLEDLSYTPISQTHVLDEVLAMIPKQTCTLEIVEYRMHVVPFDVVLNFDAPGGARLNTSAPHSFFRNPGWRGVDRALARLASGRTMRVSVEIAAILSYQALALCAPQDMFDDSIGMDSLMKKWGRKAFVELGKEPRADITVSACLDNTVALYDDE